MFRIRGVQISIKTWQIVHQQNWFKSLMTEATLFFFGAVHSGWFTPNDLKQARGFYIVKY